MSQLSHRVWSSVCWKCLAVSTASQSELANSRLIPLGSPKAWRRHLDGCACLLRAMNIRGDSGGVEQALFWCFARMGMLILLKWMQAAGPQDTDDRQMYAVV